VAVLGGAPFFGGRECLGGYSFLLNGGSGVRGVSGRKKEAMGCEKASEGDTGGRAIAGSGAKGRQGESKS
jgi:hypothetical protein